MRSTRSPSSPSWPASPSSAWLWRGRWDAGSPAFAIRFSLTLVLGLLFSPHLNPHDGLVLVPAAAIAYGARPAMASRAVARRRPVRGAVRDPADQPAQRHRTGRPLHPHARHPGGRLRRRPGRRPPNRFTGACMTTAPRRPGRSPSRRRSACPRSCCSRSSRSSAAWRCRSSGARPPSGRRRCSSSRRSCWRLPVRPRLGLVVRPAGGRPPHRPVRAGRSCALLIAPARVASIGVDGPAAGPRPRRRS